MKRSSIAVIIAVLMVALAGVIYIGRLSTENSTVDSNQSKPVSQDVSQQETAVNAEGISFGEIVYKISSSETITAKCMKSDGIERIYSLNPVTDKKRYDISSSGSMAVYLAKDSSIWLLYNDGTKKKLTPDKYDSISKADMLAKNPGYIWAYEPEFTTWGTVRFISNLPDTSDSPGKSLWEVGLDGGNVRDIYTVISDNFKSLGSRDDGKYMVLDGANIAVVDTASGSADMMDVKDKYIIGLSPNGTRIVYMAKGQNGQPDGKNLMTMDSYGNNNRVIPGVEGFTATDMGAWSSNSQKYAFIIKSAGGLGDKIAIVSFGEEDTGISAYNPPDNAKFPEGSKLGWTDDGTVSVDTGDSIINVDIE